MEQITNIRLLMLHAYDAGRRNLPWREETDPYRIWVSEIMLQQTRVETVLPYYKEWIARFPNVEALAQAEEEEVLKAWEGLGYYSRARRLWGGARVVREKHGGRLPESADELKSLPGVGDYTAGAVASIAFGEVVPAVDGNVRRVLSRLFDLADPSAGELKALAAELVDPFRPGDFNQALMEHGALVCRPKTPGCGECVVAKVCLALERGMVGERPAKKARKPVPEVDVVVLVAVRGDGSDSRDRVPSFLLRKRPDTGLLAGMWEFPGVEVERVQGVTDEEGPPAETMELLRKLMGELALESAGEPKGLDSVPHLFSHLKAVYWPYLVQGKEAGASQNGWMDRAGIQVIPLPVAQRKILLLATEALADHSSSEV